MKNKTFDSKLQYNGSSICPKWQVSSVVELPGKVHTCRLAGNAWSDADHWIVVCGEPRAAQRVTAGVTYTEHFLLEYLLNSFMFFCD